MTAKHVYLCGLSEQSFPAGERAGRLYADEDFNAFQRAARGDAAGDIRTAASAPHSSRGQDEMLLFYEVLTRAEEDAHAELFSAR